MSELNLNEDVLKRRVWNQSIYDSHIKDFMLGQTPPYINKDRNVIDVGAAVGLYSNFWADKCKNIYSFEAVTPVYEQLKLVEAKHGNMAAFNVAVSNFVGKADFWVDDKRLSNSSFRDLVGGQKITVPVTTIDHEDLGKVGFIKIDVEGHELDVLKGAEKTIEKYHPTIMCEIYPKFNNGDVSHTFDFLFDRGYNCYYNIKGQGLSRVMDTARGVLAATNEGLIKQHDGDFLFTYGN